MSIVVCDSSAVCSVQCAVHGTLIHAVCAVCAAVCGSVRGCAAMRQCAAVRQCTAAHTDKYR